MAAVIAVRQQNQTVAAQHTAIARDMVAQADRIRAIDPWSALQLNVAANQLEPTDRNQPRRLGQPLAVHTDSVKSVEPSPEGHTLATASSDKTVTLWDMTRLEELQRDSVGEACMRADGPLDKVTWDFYAPGVSYQDTCAAHR